MNIELIIMIAVIYLILNGVSLSLFYADKRKAVKSRFRIKESTLLISGLLGPFGALIGMVVFRHKTRKTKFLLIYVFLFIHIAIVIFILWKLCF